MQFFFVCWAIKRRAYRVKSSRKIRLCDYESSAIRARRLREKVKKHAHT